MGSQQKNFDAFVDKAIHNILAGVRGRAAEAKSVREMCTDVLGQFSNARQAGSLSPPLSTELACQVVKIICQAVKLAQTNVQETCLNLLHKLVAYAWLQAETSSIGAMTEDNLVCQAIRAITDCADSMNSQVHLGVIQALLTIAMSELFVVHGEALVQCLKIIFNLAIATDEKMISLTAHNALLQICNTVVRHTVRSTAYPLHRVQDSSPTGQAAARHALANTGGFPAPSDSMVAVLSSPHRSTPPNEAALASFTPPEYNTSGTTRTAQLFALAEQCDLQGLEAAFEGIPAGGSPGVRMNGAQPSLTLSYSSTPRYSAAHGVVASGTSNGPSDLGNGFASSTDLGVGATVPVADVSGGSMVQGELVRAASGGTLTTVKRMASVRSLASSRSGVDLKPRVDVLEADLIMVLTALCRIAGRRIGGSDDDVYIVAGRHLASDILLKVMESSGNPWGSVSAAAWMTLRQPICMVLLRSAAMEDPSAFPLAPRLFACILCRTPLRLSLKPELGAFFPLLLHKPLEMDSAEASLLAPALEASARIAAEPQLMVDLFVNYDCDLHSVNIFERWIHGLQRVVVGHDELAGGVEHGVGSRAAAISCITTILKSLDRWTVSLDAAAETKAAVSVSNGNADVLEAVSRSEAEIEEAKAMKDKRDVGLKLFRKKPLKAVRLLQSKGVLQESAGAVAAWLRQNLQLIDRDALGVLFGESDPAAVAIMHQYIDQESFGDMYLDEALRQLLHEFKLPGEAQQIDRIMEKFADVFCRQNPGMFRMPEDAYRLAFATIMLNTDTHNPLADHILGFETFVEMNSDADENGLSVPALSRDDLRGVFDRIVAKEIRMVGQPASSSPSPASPRKRLLHPARLAAALGLSAFIDSLQYPNGMRQYHQEARPQKLTLAVSSSKWHTAAATQHVRGILQVSSLSILDVIKEGLRLGAASPKAYSDALEAVRVAIRLSSATGHYTFTDDAVSMLTTATGVYSPAPPASHAESRQMQALRLLMDIALGPEGLILGPSWWLVLRCISVIEAIAETAAADRLDGGVQSPRSPRSPRTPGSLRSSRAVHDPSREGSVLPEGVLMSSLVDVEERVRSAFSGLSSWLPGLIVPEGGSTVQRSRDALFSPSPRGDGHVSPRPVLRPQLSSSLRQRSGRMNSAKTALQAFASSGEGVEQINAVFARSAELDGQNVLHFFQSLCAVANQELEPLAGAPPRVTSLKRLTECLFLNIDRIRLVWGRLWSIVGPQFVSASCHVDANVAMVALDSLKQLAAHLLQRSELTLFNWQQQALEPFLQTLQHAHCSNVRCMALGCLKHFLQRNPSQLGSGWAQIVRAIWQALRDGKLAVVEEGLATLAAAIPAAETAGCFQMVAPALLGLAVIAATLESHPHLCFAALNCIEAMTAVLLRQRIGTLEVSSANAAVSEEPLTMMRREKSGFSTTSGGSALHLPLDLLLMSEPWLEPLQATAATPWASIVHAYALIATNATHDAVSDQGVEEAMRLLHKFSVSWSPETLRSALYAVHEALFAGDLVPAVRQGQSVSLSPQVLSRLLNRFQTYLPSLWTLLIAEYGSLGAPMLRLLLGSLLALLHVDSTDAVRAGVAALHQMSVVLGGAGGAELDVPGWQALGEMLRDACAMDEVAAVPLPQRQMTVVMVQRSLVQILTHCGRCMPPSVHLELLAVLQDSVDRAAEANAQADRDWHRQKALAAGCREIEPAPGSATDDSTASVHIHAEDEMDTGAQVPSNGEFENGGVSSEAARVGRDEPGGDQSGTADSWHEYMPWLQQQNEGGQLLVKAYLRTIDVFQESAARLPTLVEAATCAEEAQERLTMLCASIVRNIFASGTAQESNEDVGGVWSLRRNGPVLCSLLQALQHRGIEEAWAKVLLPRLPMLIRCDDVRVRVGVAAVYETVLGPRVLGAAETGSM